MSAQSQEYNSDEIDRELEELLSRASSSSNKIKCPLGYPECIGNQCPYWRDGKCRYGECYVC